LVRLYFFSKSIISQHREKINAQVREGCYFRYFANLQIHVKPQNKKVGKIFRRDKKGTTNQAGQRGIFANRLKVFVVFG